MSLTDQISATAHAWWGNLTGATDRPGVLTFVLTDDGPEDIRIITDRA